MSRKIVITKGKHIAVYGNLKQACNREGWQDEYDKLRGRTTPYDHNGCIVYRIPTGVTISCFELLEVMASKNTVQKTTKEAGFYLVSVQAYDREYELEVDYTTEHEPANVIPTDRGMEEESPAHDYPVATAVTSAVELTEDGPKKIHLDKWTEGQVLNHVRL